MARGVNIARLVTGTPNLQSLAYTAGQVFKLGALVVDIGAGTISECGATPAVVLGVALQGAATGPGFDNAGTPAVVTGQRVEVTVALADRTNVFSMRGVSGGTDPLVPTLANIGKFYGVLKVGNDWVLNILDVTALVFKCIDIDIPNNIFFCKFKETVLSLP